MKAKTPAKKTGLGYNERAFIPTDEQRKIVALAAGAKMSQMEIVRLITNPKTGKPIRHETLRKVFGQELETGYTTLKLNLHQAVIKSALDGNVTAQIWAQKTLFGVRENLDVLVPQSDDGDEDVIKKARRIAFALSLGAYSAFKAEAKAEEQPSKTSVLVRRGGHPRKVKPPEGEPATVAPRKRGRPRKVESA